jgi:arsenate reductase (thioredoxin)
MKRVMFVCKKNSARSQMAEGFAKALAHPEIEIVSSGLEAIAAMDAVGIDIRSQTSKALSDFNAKDFDVVISLCGCGVNLPQDWVLQDIFEDWQLDDPAEQPEIFPRVRDEVQERVKALVQQLSN